MCVHNEYIDDNLQGVCRHCGQTKDYRKLLTHDAGYLRVFGDMAKQRATPVHVGNKGKPIAMTGFRGRR